MHVVLHVTSEFQDDQKILLRLGQKLNIGRGGLNDFSFPSDATMSHEHFAIELSTDGCQLTNLKKKNVTTINGQPVDGVTDMQDGDEIVAGQTSFRVSLEDAADTTSPESSTPASGVSSPASSDPVLAELDSLTEPDPTAPSPVQPDPVNLELVESDKAEPEPDLPLDGVQSQAFEHFRQLPQPLFAILDAARDPMVLVLLMQSDNEYQSLYEGEKGDTLAAVAPYLVKLPADSRLLRKLIALGWGQSWGIYLTCDQSFKDVRKHFRKFLMVKTDEGKEVYFRFYDPRVLRVFLPTCIPKEAEQFFGPVTAFYLEDEQPDNLLRIPVDNKGAKEIVQLNAELDLQGTEST